MYDIIIAGGGPAGATLARLIGNRYKVLLLEKRHFKEGSQAAEEKCCGGLIAPDAQKMLAKFGLGIPGSVVLSPQLFSVRTIDFDNAIERYYQRNYINVNREAFDRWLLDLASEKVEIRTGCLYKSFHREEDCTTVTFGCGGKIYEEKTRLFIGADGAHSIIRRQAFPKSQNPKLYVAIQEWYDTEEHLNYYGAMFDREITDFYSWTIPEENRLILGSALTMDGKATEKFHRLKEKMASVGFRLKQPVKRNGAYIYRTEKLNQIQTGDDKVILLGEAAGFISPSSAEGFSYAFRSAVALSDALREGTRDGKKRYDDNLSSLRRNILLKNMKSPAMYHTGLRKWVMKSGVLSLTLEQPI